MEQVTGNKLVADEQEVYDWVQRLEEELKEIQTIVEYKESATNEPIYLNRVDAFESKYGNGTHLTRKCIIVVGIGGAGSFVAEGLVRAGVGKIGLIDRGMVEASCMGTSVYRRCYIGEDRVTAMKHLISNLNADCQVETACEELVTNQCTHIFNKVAGNLQKELPDLVITCLDNLEARLATNDWCVARGVPLIDSFRSHNGQEVTARCYTQLSADDKLETCLRCDKSARSQADSDQSTLDIFGEVQPSRKVPFKPRALNQEKDLRLSATRKKMHVLTGKTLVAPVAISEKQICCTAVHPGMNALLAGMIVQKATKWLICELSLQTDRYQTGYNATTDVFETSNPFGHRKAKCSCI